MKRGEAQLAALRGRTGLWHPLFVCSNRRMCLRIHNATPSSLRNASIAIMIQLVHCAHSVLMKAIFFERQNWFDFVSCCVLLRCHARIAVLCCCRRRSAFACSNNNSCATKQSTYYSGFMMLSLLLCQCFCSCCCVVVGNDAAVRVVVV